MTTTEFQKSNRDELAREQPTSNREAELTAIPRIGSGVWLGGVWLGGVSRYNRAGIIHLWEKGKDGNLYSECGQWERPENMQPVSEGTRWCKKCLRIIEKEKGIATPPNVVDTLKERYTLKKPCCVSDEPDAHTVWLKIGNQSFRLDGYFETADEAEWMRKMLATALMNFQLDTDKLKQPNGPRSATPN